MEHAVVASYRPQNTVLYRGFWALSTETEKEAKGRYLCK
ncbi:unnamed protein product [Ectocarpus sp. CCAP 1310/34]|nr:unnamed protein product [Ectocarpus sp. CCAP 1310/34]